MCVSNSNGINVFQSGGGAPCITKTKVAKEEKMLACGVEVHRPGEVVLVSKTIYLV